MEMTRLSNCTEGESRLWLYSKSYKGRNPIFNYLTLFFIYPTTNAKKKKKTTPMTCSARNLKQQDRQQRNFKCQYRSTLQSCFGAAILLQWHTIKAELKTEWFLIPVTASWWWGASRGVLIFSFWWSTRGYMELEWSCIRGSSYMTLEKILHPEHGWSQAAKRSGCSTKPVSAQWASGEYSQWSCLGLGSPARSKDLGSMILMGGFQLTTFQFYQSEQLSNKSKPV